MGREYLPNLVFLAHPSSLPITYWLAGNVLVGCRLTTEVFKVLSTIAKYLKKEYSSEAQNSKFQTQSKRIAVHLWNKVPKLIKNKSCLHCWFGSESVVIFTQSERKRPVTPLIFSLPPVSIIFTMWLGLWIAKGACGMGWITVSRTSLQGFLSSSVLMVPQPALHEQLRKQNSLVSTGVCGFYFLLALLVSCR